MILQHKKEPYLLEFELLGLPKTTNSYAGMKWQAKHVHVKRWKALVFAVAAPYRPNVPLQKAKLTLTRCSSKKGDFDGRVSSFKCIIDALIEVGILADDNEDVISVPSYPHQAAKAREGKIRIKVEGVA